ncbi:hypothetical protein ABTL49_19390, partial [Acinetobacter baumannii]
SKSVSDRIEVRPLNMVEMSIHPDSVISGNSVTATIHLSGNAPTGGFTIALASDQTLATVPTSVTVAAGTNAVVFSVATTAVTARSRV